MVTQELDILERNAMLLIENGYKMSHIADGRPFSRSNPGLWSENGTVAWKLPLLQRLEPPYGRYRAVHDAWKAAGEPTVVISLLAPPAESDDVRPEDACS